jgi:hypothetical protein
MRVDPTALATVELPIQQPLEQSDAQLPLEVGDLPRQPLLRNARSR